MVINDMKKKPTQNEEETATVKPSSVYQPSDAVKQAQNALQQQLNNKPGAYQSQWQTQLNDTISKIMNREKFSYDLNGDALYQQYKDQYTNAGKMAMMDTMGQAQAMTGGYGNSYAQMVGQQAYQGQLQNLNDKIPELYQLALNQYNQQGQDLYNRYSMLGAQEEQEYGRHRDTVSDWNAQTDRFQNRYDAERNFDYGQFADKRAYDYQVGRDTVADRQWQQNFEYQQNRDQVADQQWKDSFQHQKDRDAVADSQWRESFDYQQGRDQVADSQWDKTFLYQQDRDQVADQQWDKSFQYQQDRDKVSDQQWQKEFDEAVKQWNQNFDYQAGRDQIADQQWNQSFQYQQDRDAAADKQWQAEFDEAMRQWNQSFDYQQDRDQVADQQWDKSFDYQQNRDQVADSQWDQSFRYQQMQDQIANQQWQKEFNEAVKQWNQSFDYQAGRDQVADSQWDQSFQYQQNRDQVADSQWDKAFDYQQGRDQMSDSQWQKEFDEAVRQFNHVHGITDGDADVDTPRAPYSPQSEEPDDDFEEQGSDKPTPAATEVAKTIRNALSSGESIKDIEDYINYKESTGVINKGQSQALKNKYTPSMY